MWIRRLRRVGTPTSADQKVINAVVNVMDPITLWRWKKAIDERVERTRGTTSASGNTRVQRPRKDDRTINF